MNDRSAPRNYDVLLIDDSDGDVELLQHSLRDGGFPEVRITRADRLWVGLELLRSNRYDVIVLDLSLPDSDGRATFYALRRRASDCPIVVVTGDSDDALGAALVREGAQDCIVKGEFSAHSLVRSLRHAVERHRAEKALKAARETALSASRAKTEFVSSISHEIRTPLNAILGMAEMLMGTELAPGQEEYVRIIGRAGHSLLDLINGVLDLSQMEAGDLSIREVPFALDELFESTCELLAFDAHRKGLALGLRIDPGVPRTMKGDSGRLRQILVNLIGNAIKFTPEGSVCVYVDRVLGQPGRLCIRVCDTGIGVPEEQREAIFESFTQADGSVARSYGGTGLGLTISVRLAKAMGGGIEVDSVVGQGSEFRAVVQLAQAEVQPADRPEPRPGQRALVIDDHPLERTLLAEALGRLGLAVRTAANGDLGIEEVDRAEQNRSPFDLVFVDCRMPGTHGFAVAERLAGMPGGYARAVMLLTTDHRRGDIERCQAAGFAAYLFKPVKESALAELVLSDMADRVVMKPSERRASAGPKEQGLRILLAEDSCDNQLLIRSYLQDSPHDLVVAQNGIEAVNHYRAHHFDLVLMDMQMPIKDGYGATREIRSLERNEGRSRTRIVALTAHAFEGQSEKSFAAGCDEHVCKPISKRRLLEVIGGSIEGGPADAASAPSNRASPRILITPDPEIANLVPGYLDARRQEIAVLQEALAAADFDHIERLAHNMKGSGAGYGCAGISAIGAQMETAAHAADRSAVAGKITGLMDFLSRVVVAESDGVEEKDAEGR